MQTLRTSCHHHWMCSQVCPLSSLVVVAPLVMDGMWEPRRSLCPLWWVLFSPVYVYLCMSLSLSLLIVSVCNMFRYSLYMHLIRRIVYKIMLPFDSSLDSLFVHASKKHACIRMIMPQFDLGNCIYFGFKLYSFALLFTRYQYLFCIRSSFYCIMLGMYVNVK